MGRLLGCWRSAGRLAVPRRADWLRAGRAIREVGRRHGYEKVGRARLTNDALMLATAVRLGATVVTRNPDDFTLLQDHLLATVVAL